MFQESNNYYFLSLTNAMLKFLKASDFGIQPNFFSIRYFKNFVESIDSSIAITLHIGWLGCH